MVSFIIISKDKKKREEYVKSFTKEHSIDPFDTTVLEKDSADKKSTLSIGIEDIKQLQKKLFLKPIKSKTKAVIIEDAQLLTPEAQNALLKVLEEPPAQTMILLCTTSKETLLPTILSRCQIIELETEPLKLKEKDLADIQTFIANLPNFSVGEKLKQAEKLGKDKDKAMVWIEKLILVLREQTLTAIAETDETTTREEVLTLRALQKLSMTLKTTNVNPRFAIENTLLSL
jgi:DNA polymerase III delta prime subunit